MRRLALLTALLGLVAAVLATGPTGAAAVRPWPCYDPTNSGKLCLPPPCPGPYENQTYDICLPYPYPCPYTDCCPPNAFWCPDPAELIAVQSPPCSDAEYPCDPPPYPLPCYPVGKLCVPVPPCDTQTAAAKICVPDPCRLLDSCIPDPCEFGCCPPEDYCY